jgi:hypothetical protein
MADTTAEAATTDSNTDLAVFERSLEGIPRSTIDRSTAAKFKLETHYKTLTQYVREREERYFIEYHLLIMTT